MDARAEDRHRGPRAQRKAPAPAGVAYLAADLDRRYARDNLPDHGNLLANLVRWAARDDLSLMVEGPGLIDCHFYRQPGRAIPCIS